MDFVGSFAHIFSPLVRRINYLRMSNDNVNDLQNIVQNLTARRNDVQNELGREENAGPVVTDIMRNWIEAVHEIEMEAHAIEVERNQGTCARGWCVNCLSRYKLSKRSVDLKLNAVYRLNEQFTEPLLEAKLSIHRTLRQVLDCLADPEIGIVGLYGMGGVGKTTLAKKVNNYCLKGSVFEIVIMISVSATPDLRSIQTSIGERLGLPDNCEADTLFDVLKKKEFLLILDDVWSPLKLEDIGIPYPGILKGCKILVISRYRDTCTDMVAIVTIKVQPLSEAESWELFLEVAGEHAIADGIEPFARHIVGMTYGLPLLIIASARAMANLHGVGSWANALAEMKTTIRGMIDPVLVPLKFSFDCLDDDMLRSLFLYCACFPENHPIEEDDILNYCVGEGLVDYLGSLTAARNKYEYLIGSLKIAGLLEDGEKIGSVKMHDMMQNLAFWIISCGYDSSPKFLIRIGKIVKEAPQVYEWVDTTRISLIDTQIKELPELSERCQKLTTFLFRHNRILTVIPPTNFLQHMDHLSVLDLSYSSKLESLPDSLSCLVNLRVFRSRYCSNLRALPSLGMLPRLKLIDLGYCFRLHQQIFGSESMGGASNLRYLDVEHSGVSIPGGVISRLHKLEELRLNKIKWWVSTAEDIKGDDKEDEKGRSGSRDSIIDVGELSRLTYLTFLSISFKGMNISGWFKPLAKMISRLQLECCKIVKQDALQALNESQNLQYFRIFDCLGVTCFPYRVRGNVIIENCEDFEKLFDGAEAYENDSLQYLYLSGLPKLERICTGLAPLNCFNQLQCIEIENCNSLKVVFTKGMPNLFKNLEKIAIIDCGRVEVIFEPIIEEADQEEEIGGDSPFPRLKTLQLKDLPTLADLCTNHILHCPLIKHVEVSGCPKLKKDPLDIQNADGLLVIDQGGWWERGMKVMEEEIQASL